MTETTTAAAGAEAGKTQSPADKHEESFWVFLLKLAVVVFVFRSFIFSPFSIPSESMLPRLWNGDQLLASKWAYGYSRNSLPFSLPLIPGRIFASQPERGDVAIFKHPVDGSDYIKRVIGLPGDQIQMIGGVLHINGKAVPKVQVDDFVIPVSPNTDCREPQFETTLEDGTPACRYPQYRETLPNGVSYNVLDFGQSVADYATGINADNTQVYIVPEGHLFMMGDNRDNSLDSRFPAISGKGVGFVPQENLVGRASVMMWSSDGSASYVLPWTWFTAARWSRLGSGI